MRVGRQAEAPESVFAHWRSVEAWYRDDPSLLRWRLRTHQEPTSDRPDQSSTRRNRRFTLIAMVFGLLLAVSACIVVLPGEAESGSAGVQPDEE
jgi:hypothetical protein